MMLTFGIWVVIQPSSHDANQVFLISVLFALLNDCVLIGIYFNPDANKRSSELRFAVAYPYNKVLNAKIQLNTYSLR